MAHRRTASLLAAIAAALCALLSARAARAGNDNELMMGNRAALVAAAIVASAADPSAAWYNPAGLGAIDRDQFDVSGTAYTMRFYAADDFIASTDGETEDASVTEFVAVPTQIAYVRALSPGVVLGIGYFVPRISNLVLREQLRAGDDDTGSTWQLSMSAAATEHHGALALGLALSPRVRLGVSFYGSYAVVQQAVSFFGATQRGGVKQRVLSDSSLFTGTRMGLEAGVGLQVDASPRVKLGLSLRGPRVRLYEGVDATFNSSDSLLHDEDGAARLDAEPGELTLSDDLGLLRAGHATLGIAYDYGHGFISTEIEVEPGLREPDDRRTIVNARVGIYHTLSESVALGVGLFTDHTPFSLEVEPGSAEGDFYGGTLGIELSNKHALAPGEPVDSLIFSTVFALRYAFSFGRVGRLIVDPHAAPSENPLSPGYGGFDAQEIGLFVGSGLQF